MKIRFLGTGTSTGNPEIGCRCEVCQSTDERDIRFRASILVQVDNRNILIDCGPDFRQQMLQIPFAKLDAVLITHEHYDHVGGIDDLRPFCQFGEIEIYAEKLVVETLIKRIPYCFEKEKYPGVPKLNMNEIDLTPFQIGQTEITPIRVMHKNLPIVGFRIKDFAYLTDLKTIPEAEFEKLKGLDILVIDALRLKTHISHETLSEALENIKRIAPKRAYLIHMSHDMGLHAQVTNALPPNVFLSYDGLELFGEERGGSKS